MAQAELNYSNVCAVFEKMGSEAVPQHPDSDSLLEARCLMCLLAKSWTAAALSGLPPRPGKSHSWKRTAFQYTRRRSRRRGESIR